MPSAGPCGFNLCRNTLAWPPQVHFWLILGRFDHLSLFWGVACVWDIFRLVVSYVTVYLWLLVWSQSSAAFHWEHLALAKHCCLKALFVIEQSNDTWFVFWTYFLAELTFGFILDSSLGPAKHVSLNTSWNQCLVTGRLYYYYPAPSPSFHLWGCGRGAFILNLSVWRWLESRMWTWSVSRKTLRLCGWFWYPLALAIGCWISGLKTVFGESY